MLARWFLDVRFHVFFVEIAVISGAGEAISGVPNLVLAGRVLPSWLPGGSFWKFGSFAKP